MTSGGPLLLILLLGSSPSLLRARELDEQGVHAFRDGRYRDAIRFFEAARKLGGPSSEIWNIARCQQKLDEPEKAAQAFEQYLAESDLSSADRTTATRELDELRRRPSQLSVDTDPPGATFFVDGRPVPSATPAALDVPPGKHAVRIESAGYEPVEQPLEARLGRAILVSVKLTRSGPIDELDEQPKGVGAPETTAVRRFALSAEGGVIVLDDVAPMATVAAHYVFDPESKVLVMAGVRLVGSTYQSEADLSTLASGAIAYRIGPRFRVGAELGVGVAARAPAFATRAALTGSFSLTSALRIGLSPVTVELHPAGPSWRLGPTAGIAIDL
jgi:hypothetical protein